MAYSLDPDAVWPQILEALHSGNTERAHDLLWPADGTCDWYLAMAPLMESAGDQIGSANTAVAIFCYEQARHLYETESAGATSGGEGMALTSQMRGSHLGRKIWLLKS
jgi:hypothetical protein